MAERLQVAQARFDRDAPDVPDPKSLGSPVEEDRDSFGILLCERGEGAKVLGADG
ncbi:MAG: hypothetical protein ACYDBY_17755 [Thermoanaerobaculia bacterium]